jgi:tetratricopeptide (TPR) repeat protein
MNQPGRAPDPAALLRLAFAHHQAGRTVAARAHYQDVLALAPTNPDALHLLGLIEIGDGATEAGIARIRAALAEAPTMLAAWANLGTALRRAGRPEEALPCFARVLAATPLDPDALAGTGHALRDLGRTAEAVAALTAATTQRPQDGALHAALGLALQAEERHAEAEAALRTAAALRPADASIPLNLGDTLRALGRGPEVAACFRRALELRPNYPEALINLGAVALEAKSFLESETLQRRALALRPDSAEAHLGLGNVLMARDQPAQAAASYRTAIRLAPTRLDARSNLHAALVKLKLWPEMLANAEAIRAAHPSAPFGPFALGDALSGFDRFDDAIQAYRAAIALDPAQHPAWEGIGNAERNRGRLPQAIAAFRQAILAGPENHSARANLALAQLVTGDLPAGLDGYESRWDCNTALTIRPRPDTPLWTGAAPLADKRILLQAEQGFGDTLQMLRYVAPVAARAAHVVLEVQPRLRTLLADFPGVQLITAEQPRPPTDLHITLMSLPRAFRTTLASIPAAARLAIPAVHRARWASLLPPDPRPSIGVVWAGNPGHSNDRNRSIPLALFRRIIAAAPGRVLVLHPEIAAADAAELADQPNLLALPSLLQPTAEPVDFADTAAAIARLDLVITVDTAVAHLAGSLGRPTWVLLPFAPDWRWLLDREDTPWYPSLRLFRQPAPADWASVVDRVAASLGGR